MSFSQAFGVDSTQNSISLFISVLILSATKQLLDILKLNIFVHVADGAPLHDLLELFLGKADNHIFWLQVRVNNLAVSVQVVESNENLFGHAPHYGNWHASILIPLHDFKKIDAQNFKDHNEVRPVCTSVNERIQQLHSVTILDRILS